MDRLALAIETARAAGEVLLQHFGGELHVQTKSNAIDLVTVADRAAEALIVERLVAATPELAILAEESGAREGAEGAPRWVVDPLDGTTNYAHNYPHYSVAIGLAEGDEPVLGVVHDPSRDETFFAERGHGAYLRTRSGEQRISVTSATALSHSLLATGFGYDRATARHNNVEEFSRFIARVRGIRRAGSAALDMAWVAAGRLDGYWEYGLSPWDWTAGAIIVREAGGEVTTIDGERWRIGAGSLCTGPAVLVDEMLEVLRS